MPPSVSESVLRAALAGLEARRDHINQAITDLKAALAAGTTRQPVAKAADARNPTPPARRKFSPETRRRMAAAQKRRWAAARKAQSESQ